MTLWTMVVKFVEKKKSAPSSHRPYPPYEYDFVSSGVVFGFGGRGEIKDKFYTFAVRFISFTFFFSFSLFFPICLRFFHHIRPF